LHSLLFSLDCGSREEGRVGKTRMGKASMGKTSMGITSMGKTSMGITSMGNRGNMGHSDSGLVDSDVVLVNDRGLDHVVNGVDLVGLRNGIGLGDLNGVGLGHVLLNDDFPFNGDGDGNGNLNGVFLNLKLGFDTFHLGSDDGVSSDRCSNLGDGDGVSRCGSLVGGSRGNGSIRCRSDGDGRWCNGHSGLRGFGGPSDISVGSGLAHALLLDVGVASLHSLGAHLDLAVASDVMGGVGHRGTCMDMFLHSVANHGGGNSMMM